MKLFGRLCKRICQLNSISLKSGNLSSMPSLPAQPCHNGGTCIWTGLKKFSCACATPWLGDRCEIEGSGCGGPRLLDRPHRVFRSHAAFGSQPYPSNRTCSWLIRAPIGQNAAVSFRKFGLNFDSSNPTDKSKWDEVQVFNGAARPQNLLLTFLPWDTPGNFCVYGRDLILVFRAKPRSDRTVVATGFEAEALTC